MDAPQNIPELLGLIRQEGPEAVARRFRKPPISSQLLRELSLENPPLAAWIFLTTYALTPSSLLEDIGAHAADYEPAVLVPLAQNPRTPPGTLLQLLQHPDEEVRAAVAVNANLPAHAAEGLLEEKNPVVWRHMAANPALKFRAQAIIAARGDAAARLELVQNKNLHPDLLVALSGDPSPLVRHTLVATAAADDEVLQFWADSDREDIQFALMTRSSLPEDCWHSLLMSPHRRVRQAVCASRQPDEVDLLFLSRSEDKEDRLFVAACEDIPAGLQHKLVQDEETDLCVALAQNPAIWPEVAEFIVTSECVPACLAMLQNPAMPEGLFLELGWLNQPEVTAALATHEGTPQEVLEYLTNEQFSAVALAHMAIARRPAPWLRGELANALARHELPSLRALAATSLKLSESARNRLRDDPAPRVRTLAYEFLPAPEARAVGATVDAIRRCLEELDALIRGDLPGVADSVEHASEASAATDDSAVDASDVSVACQNGHAVDEEQPAGAASSELSPGSEKESTSRPVKDVPPAASDSIDDSPSAGTDSTAASMAEPETVRPF
ncbi:hypothetical protein H5P28_07620 [Ruficoccus amylovorans]|uniref:Leucine rich repeat variant n=1 Tax=Ruficoccus amylovorans TaxID=1804625 RepID=A0A842HD55_9BACT|nr:hypothetical protein [Ruficoccus amylovorans]MBC2594129.1 hypothetical protein [Ruficoccus amylovorans]